MIQARNCPSPRSKRWLACTVGLGAAFWGVAGCTPSNSVKSGAPVIVSFDPVGADGTPLTLTSDAGVVPTPPLAHFVATFDRLVDPDSLEDDAGTPKAGLASAQYGTLASPVPVTTNFVPNGDITFFLKVPAGPTLAVLPTCGLPSGSSVQVTLDLMKLRSHDLSTVAVLGPGVLSTLAFSTEPLSVVAAPDPSAVAPPAPGDTTAVYEPQAIVNVTFNDSTPGPTASACAALPSTGTHIHVIVTLAGVPVAPFDPVIAQDAADSSHWTVSPPGATASGPGGWPSGALVTVTIDAAATDTFGQALGAGSETTISFMVKS